MADEPCADRLADERRQVGRHDVHLVEQVRVQLKPVLCQRDHAARESLDVDQIDWADVLRLQVFGYKPHHEEEVALLRGSSHRTNIQPSACLFMKFEESDAHLPH